MLHFSIVFVAKKVEAAQMNDNYDDYALGIAQHNTIVAEQTHMPLISEQLPLQRDPSSCLLAHEIFPSAAMTAKLRSILPKYSAIRYVRRDGSCFYRAALFRLLESALLHDAVLEDLCRTCEALRLDIVARFSDYAADFCDVMAECLDAMKLRRIQTANDLLQHFSSPDHSEYLIFFARYAVACYLVKHEEDLFPFVAAAHPYASMDEFCKHEVEVVGQDSDHIHLVAFANAFHVELTVEYLDASPGDVVVHNVSPTSATPTVRIPLLYRPGHYDLLVAEQL